MEENYFFFRLLRDFSNLNKESGKRKKKKDLQVKRLGLRVVSSQILVPGLSTCGSAICCCLTFCFDLLKIGHFKF